MRDLAISEETATNELELIEPQSTDKNPGYVYLASLGPGSQRVQTLALESLAEILTGSRDIGRVKWQALRFEHTAALRAILAERYKPATANRMLAALRKTLESAWLLKQMPHEDYAIAAHVEDVVGETLPAGREVSPGERAALKYTCRQDRSPAGARDNAIFALGFCAGLRREEIVKLDVDHYDPQTGRLEVFGKNSKERTDYLKNGAAQAMRDWLALRGLEPGPLFWPINKSGALRNSRLVNQTIYDLCESRALEAGIAKFSPHDMRRTCAGDMLSAGIDISTVSHLLGHKSPITTARYDRRGEETKERASELLTW